MAKKIKTKSDDIRKLSDADLKKEIDESYRRIFALSLQRETLQLQNHREIPKMRRNVARLKTIERQRQLAAGATASGGAA
ncbi:MAG: 50S ribosomal protein L29 [Dehalococcoidia bacterium]